MSMLDGFFWLQSDHGAPGRLRKDNLYNTVGYAGATFQRAMDITFAEEKDKFIVIYLDDITVFSDSDEQHLEHMKKIF
jgi:hypothetical protein